MCTCSGELSKSTGSSRGPGGRQEHHPQGQPLNTVTTPCDNDGLADTPDSDFYLLLPGAEEGGGSRGSEKVKERAERSLPCGSVRYRIGFLGLQIQEFSSACTPTVYEAPGN